MAERPTKAKDQTSLPPSNINYSQGFDEVLSFLNRSWEVEIIQSGKNVFQIKSHNHVFSDRFHSPEQALSMRHWVEQTLVTYDACKANKKLWADCAITLRALASQNEKPGLVIQNGGFFGSNDTLIDSATLDGLLARKSKSIISDRPGRGDIYERLKQLMGDMRSVIAIRDRGGSDNPSISTTSVASITP